MTGFVNIIDYGAVPDTNNPAQRTANAAAILEAAAASPAILVPGTFWTDPVQFPNTTRVLAGLDKSVSALRGIIGLPAGGALITFEHDGNPLAIEKLACLAPVDGTSQAKGLRIHNAADVELRSVRAEGWMAFELISCADLTLDKPSITAWSNTAINAVGLTRPKIISPTIRPALNNAASVGLGLSSCSGTSVVSGNIDSPGVFGIYVNSCDNTTIMGVVFKPGLRESISIGSTDNAPGTADFTISGCVLTYSPASIDFGISVAPGANSRVSQGIIANNVIDSPGASGIALLTAPNSWVTDVLVRGNRIINPAHNIGGDANYRCGIQAFAAQVTGNVFEGNLITDTVGQMGWAINSTGNHVGANYGTSGSLGFANVH